jgi:hypothetical protein
MTQIQAVREGDGTVIYALDREGRLWRGKPWMKETGRFMVKWDRLEEPEAPRSPGEVPVMALA